MMRMLSVSALVLIGFVATMGCWYQPQPARLVQLQRRAVFDLGCPDDQLLFYHLDSSTKAVAGCGRRLVYVESCEPVPSSSRCSWRLDTPAFTQLQWPQNYSSTPTFQVLPIPAPAPTAPPSGYPKELFGPGEQPPPPGSSQPYSQDLFDNR